MQREILKKFRRKRNKIRVILRVRKVNYQGKEEELIESIGNQKLREAILFRWKVISFHEKYGTKLTMDTFKISKATIYRWKKKWKESGENLEALIPKIFLVKRKKKWHPEIINFILEYRKIHPHAGKDILKTLCDRFCKEKNLNPPSASTIGRIIRYLKERGQLEENILKVSNC
jgi:transposase